MKCELLISTMNKKNNVELEKYMHIEKSNYVMINQVTNKKIKLFDFSDKEKKFLSFFEKGLSKSRNKAIINSNADICLISDDDMYYEKNFESTVITAYKKYPNADIIAFVVDNEDVSRRKKILREGKLNFIQTMKLQSVQITFKRKRILDNNIKFDEQFGAGAKYDWGEENIFLFDCWRKNLKIYYVPLKIATLYKTNSSSWDRSQTKEHYEKQGIIYYRMSKLLYPLFIIQFALRKKKIYIDYLSTKDIIKSMFYGVRMHKKGKI